MRAAALIFLKDLRLRVRDRSVYLYALVVPLALTFVFSLVFPDTEDLQLSAAVVDLDGGQVASGFVDGVVSGLVDAGVVELRDVEDESEARSAVADGAIDAAWILPAEFSEDVTAGRGASLEVLSTPEQTLAGEVARAVAEDYATRIEQTGLTVATVAAALGDEATGAQLQQVAQEAATAQPAIRLEDLVAEDRQLDAISHLAAGMAVFFLFFTVQYGVTGMLEEREQGTLPRLLAAPIRVGAIHLGKALGAFALGLASMTVLAAATSLLLGAHWGHPLGVAILIFAGVAAALGIMALIGSFARTAEQAGNLQSIVALVLGLLGGVFFPLGGGLLGQLSRASPHGWFMRGLGDVVGTGRWSAAMPAAAALLAFGVVAAVPAALRLRKGLP